MKKYNRGLLWILAAGMLVFSNGCRYVEGTVTRVKESVGAFEKETQVPKQTLEPVAETDGIHQEYYFKQLAMNEKRSYRQVFRCRHLDVLVVPQDQLHPFSRGQLHRHGIICDLPLRSGILHHPFICPVYQPERKCLGGLDLPQKSPVRRPRHKAVPVPDLDRVLYRHSGYTGPMADRSLDRPLDHLPGDQRAGAVVDQHISR